MANDNWFNNNNVDQNQGDLITVIRHFIKNKCLYLLLILLSNLFLN